MKMEQNNIVSLSGGKDSTAMLHMMLDRGENIHSVVFFDTGWEFPEMADHISLVKQKTGVEVLTLEPRESFERWMYHRKIKAMTGEMKGEIHRIGNCWPSPMRRWCTREKVNAINRCLRGIEQPVSCIGYAADETHRDKDNNGKIPKRYPLIEYGITEEEALKYCRELGYHWGGLYDVFDRVSCWCCPLQGIKGARKLRKHRPELWEKLIEMDMRQPRHNPGWLETHTAIELECRFRKEDRQLTLFDDVGRVG